MPWLSARVSRLEQAEGGDERRPVLLICPGDNEGAALADWQGRYGPCEAEPLYIRLIGPKGGFAKQLW